MLKVVLNKKRAERVAHRLSLPVRLMSKNCIIALEKISLYAAEEFLPSGDVSPRTVIRSHFTLELLNSPEQNC